MGLWVKNLAKGKREGGPYVLKEKLHHRKKMKGGKIRPTESGAAQNKKVRKNWGESKKVGQFAARKNLWGRHREQARKHRKLRRKRNG